MRAQRPRPLSAHRSLPAALRPPLARRLFVKAEMTATGLTDMYWTDDGTCPPLIAIWALLLVDAALCFSKSVYDSNHSLKKVPMPKAVPGADTHTPTVSRPPEGLKEVVTMRNLGRAFAATPKPVVALENLNLSLYEGQITALLGQNGAGKSEERGDANALTDRPFDGG